MPGRIGTTGKGTRGQLARPRSEIHEAIVHQIAECQALRASDVSTEDDLESVWRAYHSWYIYTREMLRLSADTELLCGKLPERMPRIYIYEKPPLNERLSSVRSLIDDDVAALHVILRMLDLIPDTATAARAGGNSVETSSAGTNVFVVHGHDEAAKLDVARTLERLGLCVSILHELPNRGNTVIEKLEREARNASFAVVIMSEDDLGGKSRESLTRRARQNVVFELGYFVALLGRDRVCALRKGDPEIPSDVFGVLYIPMDGAGAWRHILAKELDEVGFSIDLNRLK